MNLFWYIIITERKVLLLLLHLSSKTHVWLASDAFVRQLSETVYLRVSVSYALPV
jgi:hypothetical protein